MRRMKAKLARLKGIIMSRTYGFKLWICNDKSVDFKAIIGVVVYIAMIPLITEMLSGLSDSLTGISGTLLSSIIALVPLLLVVKVLDKINF